MAASSQRRRGPGRPPVLVAVRVVGLALLLWGFASEVRPGLSGARLATWLLIAAFIPAWVTWGTAPDDNFRRKVVTFCWLGAVGGVLALFAPIALVVIGTAAMGAATALEIPVTLAVAAVGPAALAITAAFRPAPGSLVIGGVAVSLAGLVVGVGRRQSVQRAEQALLVSVERERAELEHSRADMLAERNRLAREVHDVLAHTLGGLVVQLGAVDAQLGAAEASSGEVNADLRAGLRRTRSLAADGLAEARRAVGALREDAVPLRAQLERLCELRGATLTFCGGPRELAPEATLTVYRVAQEALTNVAKHAPGAGAEVRLGYEPAAVSIAVRNGAGARLPDELARSGAGYGLDGIRERVMLLGGEVSAGADGMGGWLVDARLPA